MRARILRWMWPITPSRIRTTTTPAAIAIFRKPSPPNTSPTVPATYGEERQPREPKHFGEVLEILRESFFFCHSRPSPFAAHAMDSTPAIRDHLCGYQFKCDDDQRGYNDNIVEMPDDRDKVGNEIKG